MKIPKKLLIGFLTVMSLSLAVNAMANLKASPEKVEAVKKSEPKLVLDTSSKVQGDFFEVLVENPKNRPTVWFNTEAYKTFQVSDTAYRALIPVENLTEPGSYSILAKAKGWSEKLPVIVKDNGKGVQQITLTPDKDAIYATDKELNEIGRGFSKRTDNKFWQGKFILPSNARKSSPFGVKRSYNKAPVSSYHKGLDFAANMGAPVIAPADGIVVVEGYEKDGYNVHGNTLILDHGHGVTSIYMHLSKIDVKKGDSVKQGEKIGEVGHTGISTGPHLHWGVYLYGTSVDPEHFMAKSVE